MDGARHDRSELAAQRIEIELLAQALAERVDGRLRVVGGPVEATVDRPLDPAAKRLERDSDSEGRERDSDRARRSREASQNRSDQNDAAEVDDGERRDQERIARASAG